MDVPSDQVMKRARALFNRGWDTFKESIEIPDIRQPADKDDIIRQIAKHIHARDTMARNEEMRICNALAESFWTSAFPGRPMVKDVHHTVRGTFPYELNQPVPDEYEYYYDGKVPNTDSEGSLSADIGGKWHIELTWQILGEYDVIGRSTNCDKIIVHDHHTVHVSFLVNGKSLAATNADRVSGDERVVCKRREHILASVREMLLDEFVFPEWLEYSFS